MSTSRLVLFRNADQGAILDPGVAVDVALLHATYVPAGGDIDVTVTGVAQGISTVAVSLDTDMGPASFVAPVAATGLFVARFTQLTLRRGSAVALAATAGSAMDRAAFVIADVPDMAIPPFDASGATVRGPKLLAGNVDRIVRSRFFSPLHAEPENSLPYQYLGLIEADRDGVFIAVKDLRNAVRGALAGLRKDAAAEALSIDDFLDKRADAYAVAATTVELPLTKSLSSKNASIFPLLVQIRSSALDLANGPMLHTVRGGRGALSTTAAVFGPVPLTTKKLRLTQWRRLFELLLGGDAPEELPVGVLFDDRVRFQPAGLVLGEEVATLSLAPGEEVQVRQTVETKRRATVEDVKDRETERQFTMSSTWSTDITASMQEADSRGSTSTLGSDLGANLGAILPIPVNVGGSASFSVNTANSTSADTSRTDHLEATTTAAARLRAQHKLRVEVTTDDASSLASTRTIRNANPLRGVTYVFFKVYRKERVSLERYSARLCLSLDVNNPSRDTRAAFVEGLRKLDPNNPANYRLRVPKVVTATWKVRLDGEEAATGGPVSHGEDTDFPYSSQTFTLGPLKLKAASKLEETLAIDPAFMLTELPTVMIKAFKDKGGVTRHGTAEFEECGGAVVMTAPPQVRSQDPDVQLVTEIRSWGEGQDDGHRIWDVDAEITSRWGPTDTDALAYAEAVADARDDLQSQLSLERLVALRDVAVAQYEGTVLSRAVEHYLTDVALLTDVADIFDVSDVFIRSTPHWATAAGRGRYRQLRHQLDALPLLITADDLLPAELTSSKARVFLPVREGREADALRLLRQFPRDQVAGIVAGLQQHRHASFPAVPRAPMTYEQVTAPTPPVSSPLGADEWASDWEKPVRQFLVLGQWSEMVPTDGVHLEMLASDTVAADEARRSALSGGV